MNWSVIGDIYPMNAWHGLLPLTLFVSRILCTDNPQHTSTAHKLTMITDKFKTGFNLHVSVSSRQALTSDTEPMVHHIRGIHYSSFDPATQAAHRTEAQKHAQSLRSRATIATFKAGQDHPCRTSALATYRSKQRNYVRLDPCRVLRGVDLSSIFLSHSYL